MKTIIELETQISKYVFENDAIIVFKDDSIETPTFIISDLNANNAKMFENVNPPNDWIGNKYLFNGVDWTLNPEWIELSQVTK